MSANPFVKKTAVDLEKAKKDIGKYLTAEELGAPVPAQKYTISNAPKEAPVLQELDNPLTRFTYNFMNTISAPKNAAENVSYLLNNLVYSGNEKAKQSADESVKRYYGQYALPELPNPDSATDTAANLLGSLAGSVAYGGLMGAGTGTSKVAESIGSKISNPLLSRVASGAAENALLGLPENVLYGVAQNENAGDMLKDIASGVVFDAAAGGLLGGASKGLEARQLKKLNQSAQKATKADEIRSAIKASDDLTERAIQNAENVAQNAPATTALSAPDSASQGMDIPNVISPYRTADEVIGGIGERQAFNNFYKSTADNIPTGTINVNGMDYNADDFVEMVDRALPDTVEELEPLVRNIEAAAAGGKSGFNFGLSKNLDPRNKIYRQLDEIADAQLYAAKRKLEWLKLPEGENGTKIRGFIQNRLIGNDEISSPEFIAALSGNADKYTPKSDRITYEAASKLVDTDQNANKFYNTLMKGNGDVLTDEQVRASQILMDRFNQNGDIDKLVDLVNVVGRSGTANARALRAYGMRKLTNANDVLGMASKQFHKAVDSELFAGASDQIDDFINRLSKNIRENWDSMDSAKLEQIINKAINETPSAEIKLKKVLQNKLGDKKSLAERIMQAVEGGALSDNELKQVFSDTLKLPSLDSDTAQDLIRLVQQAQKAPDFSQEQAEIFRQIYSTIGSKLPYSGLDIARAWRKLAMLLNPKTHLRNFTSNLAMMPLRKIDDVIAQSLESGIRRIDGMSDMLPTRSLGWSQSDFGQSIMPTVDEYLKRARSEMTNFGKFDIQDSAILRARPAFGTKSGVQWLNKLADKNFEWLDKGDSWFFDRAFKDSLGQYMTARGISNVDSKAYSYAFDRALDATFRADNALVKKVSMLKSSKNKIVREVADVIIPFTRTPANLFEQAFRYSPAGLAKSGAELINLIATKGVKGRAAADIINDFASGLSGTALFAIGWYLGGLGILDTQYATGEKQRAADELEGKQQYSIKIGNTTFSINWLQPVAAPFIGGGVIGQSLAEQDVDGESGEETKPTDILSSVFDMVGGSANSIFENSFMQTLTDLASSISQDKGKGALTSLASNLISQNIPTLLGQATRSIDPVQRKTKGDNSIDTIINQTFSKIPFASTYLQPELDAFGNTVMRGNETNPAINMFNQLLNPSSTRKAIQPENPYTQALLDVYRNTNSTKAIPSAPNAPDEGLSQAEYTNAARSVGQEQYNALQQIVDNPRKSYKIGTTVTLPNGNTKTRYVYKRWSDMTDEEKATILSRIFGNVKEDVLEG